MNSQTNFLILAGATSFFAALLHVGIVLGGPDWYRFFGAGEEFAQLAERGSLRPPVMTSGIALVLAVWALYAFSGAGIITRLPFLRVILIAITGVYLARGFWGFPVFFISKNPYIQELGFPFLFWTSTLITGVGAIHAIGVYKCWDTLK